MKNFTIFDGKKVLIANRGEIACRIIRTCQKLQIRTVAIYNKVEQDALHVAMADEAIMIESETPVASYLDKDKIIKAAKDTNSHAIIPGYGFLSENPEFADLCQENNIIFIGPKSDVMQKFALKHTAREIAKATNVPIIAGSNILENIDVAIKNAHEIGYPVVLKCSGGGGGIGMKTCYNDEELRNNFVITKKTGKACFNNEDVYIEKYVSKPRHIEVQVFGDNNQVVALGERECSIQRRFQKVVEETPSTFINDELRQNLFDAAKSLCNSLNYTFAGTVEFLVDGLTKDFYFLEVNTRLQVEHPVTEEVTGVDLVEWMLRMAFDKDFSVKDYQDVRQGHSIEVRLYAEDATRNFMPSIGTLTQVELPQYPWARYDFGFKSGSQVSSFFDPMIGKIISYGKTRRQAIARLSKMLEEAKISGVATNLPYLKAILNSKDYVENNISTEFLDSFDCKLPAIEVLKSGFFTTIQDYPGRSNYWRIGVPPSGPVDNFAFRIANAIVGNEDYGTSGLELTLEGPNLRFHEDAVIAFSGAKMAATIDGMEVEWYKRIYVKAGSVLTMRNIVDGGFRSYMAIKGGFDLPDYLGSKSTFCFGQFGGLQGVPLKIGDSLPFFADKSPKKTNFKLPSKYIPKYGKTWEIAVLYGPHGAPDFFTNEAIKMFFNSQWRVHHNSNRLGIRLIGPKPTWARTDGGEAGLHPSNIHDCEYAIGTINFTGDMPIILNCDGPSLGGFVCPATIIQSEFWKLGQISANDKITFKRVTYEEALQAKQQQFEYLENIYNQNTKNIKTDFGISNLVSKKLFKNKAKTIFGDAIAYEIKETTTTPKVVYRIAGDDYLLIEYGEMVLDLNLRFRVHALMEWFAKNPVKGILELSPGVRSVQVHYDSSKLHLDRLINALLFAESRLPDVNDMEIPSRIIKLPFAYDDKWNKEAVEKYSQSIKSKAPYLPSNIEFIARINGLENQDQVRQTILDANYMVLGLGDVYLGAPCAVPIDPRHRLLTSKYNPARTYTPEGSVGIGGVYMCIYGMDSPGGYQLVGRTLPIWNKFVKNKAFEEGKPWLLRFFDQVQYYQVSDDELEEMRHKFAIGELNIEIEETTIKPKEINQFLDSIKEEVATFKEKQNIAFEKERKHWEESGMIGGQEEEQENDSIQDSNVTSIAPEGHFFVQAHANGVVWNILANDNDKIEQDQPLIVLEAMKTEINVNASAAGFITEIKVKKGQLVNQGDVLLVVKEA